MMEPKFTVLMSQSGMTPRFKLPWQWALLPLSLWLATMTPAAAAERLTFIIGPLNRSITLEDLQELSKTGEAQGDLKTILKVVGKPPAEAGRFLSQTFPFDLVTADRLLSSKPGEVLLSKIGTILAPRNSNKDGLQALRAAILLSLSGDNQFSLLELLEKYPTDARINVDALQGFGKEFGDVTQLLGSFSKP